MNEAYDNKYIAVICVAYKLYDCFIDLILEKHIKVINIELKSTIN